MSEASTFGSSAPPYTIAPDIRQPQLPQGRRHEDGTMHLDGDPFTDDASPSQLETLPAYAVHPDDLEQGRNSHSVVRSEKEGPIGVPYQCWER